MSVPKIILDENLPHDLRRLLADYNIITVAYMGWAGVKNGELLRKAEQEGFDILITSDQGFPHQQNMGRRKLAILLLPTPNWNAVKQNVHQIEAAILGTEPGTVTRVPFGVS